MGNIINASVVGLTNEGGEFYIDAEGSDQNIIYDNAIINRGMDWIEFVEVQQEAGSAIGRYVFRATPNDTGAVRGGEVNLVYRQMSGGATNSYNIDVFQQPELSPIDHYDLHLALTPQSFDAAGGNGTFVCKGTTYYIDGSSTTVDVAERLGVDASWLIVDNDNKTFQVQQNTGAARSCIVSQLWNGVSAQVTITQAAAEATYSTPAITMSYDNAPATGGAVSPTGRITQTKTNPDGSKEYLNLQLSELENATYSVEGDGATIDSATGVLTWAANTSSNARTVTVKVTGVLNGQTGNATTTATQESGEVVYTYSTPLITLSYPVAQAAGGTVSPTGRASQIRTGSDGSRVPMSLPLSEAESVHYSITGDGATIDAATGVVTWNENHTGKARTASVTLVAVFNGKEGSTNAEATQEVGEIIYTYSDPLITLSYPTKDGNAGDVSPAGRAVQTKTGSDGSTAQLFLSFSEAESMKYEISGDGASVDTNTGIVTWSENRTGKVRSAVVTLTAVFNGKQGTATAEAEQLILEYYDAPTFAVAYTDMGADGGTGEVPTVSATQVLHKADGTTETLSNVEISNRIFSAASPYIKSIEEKTGRLRWLKNKSYAERTVEVEFSGQCNGISSTVTVIARQLAQEKIYMWPLWFDHIIKVDAGTTGAAVSYQLGYVDRKGIFDVPPSYSGRIITGEYGIGHINASEIIRHILPSGPAWMQEWIYTDDLGTSERFYVCSDFSYSPADPFVGALMYDIPPFFMTDQLQTKIWRDARFYIGAWGSAAVTQYDEAGNILRYHNYEDTYLNYVEIHPEAARMVVACGGDEQVYCCLDTPSAKPAYVLNFGNRFGAAQSLCVWGNVVPSDSDIVRTTFRNGSQLWDEQGKVPRQERVLNVRYSRRWVLNTGFLYNVPDQLMDIFVSAEAELYEVGTGNIIPVIIESTSVDYQTYRNQGNRCVNFIITVKQAAPQTTYR